MALVDLQREHSTYPLHATPHCIRIVHKNRRTSAVCRMVIKSEQEGHALCRRSSLSEAHAISIRRT
jgi:hypothetical protein